jgi:hypothetical protein
VPAGDDQRDAALGQGPVVEDVDRRVAGEVVHGVERHPRGERVRLARREAHLQRRAQPGSGGDRDGGDVGEVDLGAPQRGAHHRGHRLEVRPRRDLGHHAAEARVLVHARGQRVAEQDPARDQAHARLVARRLDAEDQRCAHAPILP